ncbi:transposase [Neobacillus vireti]|uniref:transposase n=1 Tax=Bacillaceae TaxID=186817 RepID=UPI003B586A98
MAKYSEEFKLMIVREYKEGTLGHKLLAKKYGVKSYSQVKRWIDAYEKFGEQGLKRKNHKETYSVQFKLEGNNNAIKSAKNRTALNVTPNQNLS